MRNRFKGLDLIDRVPNELWMEVHEIVQEAGIKSILKERKCKRARRLSEEALQIAEKKREAKANRVLPRIAVVIANTLFQQHKRRLYTWTSPDGQY